MLRKADIEPKTVYITPLCRTRQTAEVLFPTAKLVVVDGLKEMCFGSFEGRNYIEMEHDPDYLAWVAANCESPCPDGETKAAFSARICRPFSALVDTLEKSLHKIFLQNGFYQIRDDIQSAIYQSPYIFLLPVRVPAMYLTDANRIS